MYSVYHQLRAEHLIHGGGYDFLKKKKRFVTAWGCTDCENGRIPDNPASSIYRIPDQIRIINLTAFANQV